MPAHIPVTVIGLGAMGSALATAFVEAGHSTTVWNRTASRAAPLVEAGATRADSLATAIAASPLIVTVLTTHEATEEVLAPVAHELKGRALVTLNSGSPAGARRLAAWAERQGARYLGGAIKNVPPAVGAADTLLYYGGEESVFAEYEQTLRVLGGDTVYLGADPDLAALYEMAVGGTLLPALVGFFQGAAALQSRGLEAASMVRFAVKWFEMISSVLPAMAQEIDSGDYSKPLSTVNIFAAGAAHDAELGMEANLDVQWHKPFHDLLNQAVESGRGEESIASLTELLKGKP
ncbi:NAD(P)-binding domain-containing protein [Streptomyces anulatus]|uniref:NAD(P)-dependent oxidoreductase n=1 Tax=Streptomyces TaxID=1883 RepID=UPI0006F50270|nr:MULTISPECIES: NAD(P)-binding domain-containing protein [unclassified Streptomyces]KQX34727.1 hydroxyacid dehydrogenase [Streptomyces sp. Root1295]KRA48045.1 hydroxyacid dehydrogenase [Streptomyces sp. Root63]